MKTFWTIGRGMAASLAIMALALLAAPVLAADEDWERLGAIAISQDPNGRVHEFNVPSGRAFQRISFRARENNVRCDVIRVRFMNGQAQTIDHLRYPEDERRAFDLYGEDRRISHIHFECRPGGNNRHARLVIYGRP